MKTFEENKSITDLWIDITRKFIVVNWDEDFCEWTVLQLHRDDNSYSPYFKMNNDWDNQPMNLCDLAYVEETTKETTKETFELWEQVACSNYSGEEAIKELESDTAKYYYTGWVNKDWEFIVENSNGSLRACSYIAKIPKIETKGYTIEQLEEKLWEKIKIINK